MDKFQIKGNEIKEIRKLTYDSFMLYLYDHKVLLPAAEEDGRDFSQAGLVLIL